jgi:hypothetical protein
MTVTQFRNIASKVRSFYFTLQLNQRLYAITAALLVIFLISLPVFGAQGTKGLLAIFLLSWTAAIGYDLIALYKKVYETVIGKALLVVLVSLCTNLAIALSSQVVNDIVGIDPSKFPHTIALLSILSIPVFVVAAFGIFYGVLLVATPLLVMFYSLPNGSATEMLIPGYSKASLMPYHKTTRVIQFLSFAIYCGVTLSLSQKASQSYGTFVTDTGRSFLYQFEMYPKAPCAIEQGERIAFIADEKVLVGLRTPTGLTFQVRECKWVEHK